MDPHVPASPPGLSGSPPPLSNSLLGALSQDDDLERDDENENLNKSGACENNQSARRTFPSSLTWDSDSERETFDDDELQHFSNPHGLAAQSPGSPTCKQERDGPDCGLYQTPEKPKHRLIDSDLVCALEEQSQGTDETSVEPGMTQPSTQQLEDVDDVSGQVSSPNSDPKPKEEYQILKEGESGGAGEMRRVSERDVYSFPGDSDPESPPPGPWAHCTFIQRRRKKRALLRPFSGLGPWQRTTGTGRKTRGTPTRAKECSKRLNDEEGVFKIDEEGEMIPVEIREEQEDCKEELCQEVFTCVECSVYFKKQAHLREHMREHGHDAEVRGPDDSGRKRSKRNGLECTECGLNFSEKLLLVNHHRHHEDIRCKILEEMEKLDEESEDIKKSSHRNSRQMTHKESPSARGQFVCLKCNFSSEIPQELTNHAKMHTTRTKATGPRASPRFQHKSRKKDKTHLPGYVASTTGLRERYPTRATVQMLERPEINDLSPKICNLPDEITVNPPQESSPDHPVPASPAEPTDPPESANAKTDDGPSKNLSPQVESVETGLKEDSIPKPHPPEYVVSKATRQRRDVAFKTTGNRHSNAVVVGRTRASSRLDHHSADSSDSNKDVPKTEETEQSQHADLSQSEPEGDEELDEKKVDTPVLNSEVNSSPSLKIIEEELDETNEEDLTADDCSNKPNHKERCPEVEINEDSDEEENENLVNCLFNVLNEEDDDEDDEDIALKAVGKQCPYCQDCFDNGIGLANHIRGHLNRVGVSYKVRHFISPEEVNAIEKRFSYQKKKKKVANFDPTTFSVMRCEFCSAGFDTRAGLSSHARAHLRDFGITNWEVTASPITVLRELFSKRPDLALSVTPAFNPETQELSKEEEDGTVIKDEETEVPGSSTPPWKEEHSDGEAEGSNLLKCEVCSAVFETLRGLSNHARSHLCQLGVGMSESYDAPIDMLYQITKERSSPRSSPLTPRDTLSHTSPILTPSRRSSGDLEDDSQDVKPPLPLATLSSAVKASSSPTSPSPSGSHPSSLFGRSPSPSLSWSRSPSPILKKAPISSLLPMSSVLRSQEHKGMARAHNATTQSRPLWTTQDTDAPLNLTLDIEDNEDITCRLCGAWFETRKGLSSHARAHLRHFGVEYSESKGSPIDLLNTLILTDDFKHRATSLHCDTPEDLRVHRNDMAPPSPTTSRSAPSASRKPFLSSPHLFKTAPVRSGIGTKAPSSFSSTNSVFSPPAKKLKPSPQQVFCTSGMELVSIPVAEPMKDVGCEFCGELFENRKGLSSHARSHLRQLGITEWSVNGSPIDTLRDLIARRGLPCVMPLKPVKSPLPSPNHGSHRTSVNFSSSPIRVPRLLVGQHRSAVRRMPAPATESPQILMVKPKPEPEQVEVTMSGTGMENNGGYITEAVHPSWINTENVRPVNLVVTQEKEPSRDIRCDFCGEFFENRKGLSSHARSHLRHMGITEWSVNGSPIDTLWEVMRNQGTPSASTAVSVKMEPGQNDATSWEHHSYQSAKVSKKSPLHLLHSGRRSYKHGLGSAGSSTTPPAGKLFGVAPLGKRALGTKGHAGDRSPSTPSKTFTHSSQDHPYKGRTSADKHGVGHIDASCELCGFAFENRKALASHARAHLRQFGVTEWSVNGSPIETLSAWMRSRPETVAELHRSYLAGGHVIQKKKRSGAHWTSPILSKGKSSERENVSGSWSTLSQTVEVKNGNESSLRPAISTHGRGDASNSAFPHAQVARSELNVRVPRGIERRPLKHPLHTDGGERESCLLKTPRTSTVPALVPKPSSTPLVKLVGKIYSLKCRFCDVEFQGPLSVQEDWIRHLQQHILKLDYKTSTPSTPAKPKTAALRTTVPATTSASTTAAVTASSNPTHLPTPQPSISTPASLPPSTLTSAASPVAISGAPSATEKQILTPAT